MGLTHRQGGADRRLDVDAARDRNAREASARARPSTPGAARDAGVVNHRPKEDVMESAPREDVV